MTLFSSNSFRDPQCASVCISVHQCASVCISVHQCASVCISVHQCASVYFSVHTLMPGHWSPFPSFKYCLASKCRPAWGHESAVMMWSSTTARHYIRRQTGRSESNGTATKCWETSEIEAQYVLLPITTSVECFNRSRKTLRPPLHSWVYPYSGPALCPH